MVVNGVMYFTMPDHVWAIDARTGRELWHHVHQSKGGIHIGNRGVAVYGSWLYFETPDCHLVSLNLKDGRERWQKSICDLDQMYYASVAPIIVKNHVLVGVSGDDPDIPGYFESRDPETGDLQWHWSVVPKKGEPGFETWPNEDAAAHGGGMTWGTTTYDPELNQIYLGTGNPQPVIAGKGREGDNLYTASIVALNPDTARCSGTSSLRRTIRTTGTTSKCRCCSRDGERAEEEAARDGLPQRLVLRAGPCDRQGDRFERVREDELVEGDR